MTDLNLRGLVRRLRDPHCPSDDDCAEAADVIEAQAKHIAALTAALKAVADLEPELPFYVWGQINNALEKP